MPYVLGIFELQAYIRLTEFPQEDMIQKARDQVGMLLVLRRLRFVDLQFLQLLVDLVGVRRLHFPGGFVGQLTHHVAAFRRRNLVLHNVAAAYQ